MTSLACSGVQTVMVANIWGEPSQMEETLSTLRFGARVRTLTTDVSQLESADPALLAKRYERQIKELKQELALRDTLRWVQGCVVILTVGCPGLIA